MGGDSFCSVHFGVCVNTCAAVYACLLPGMVECVLVRRDSRMCVSEEGGWDVC